MDNQHSPIISLRIADGSSDRSYTPDTSYRQDISEQEDENINHELLKSYKKTFLHKNDDTRSNISNRSNRSNRSNFSENDTRSNRSLPNDRRNDQLFNISTSLNRNYSNNSNTNNSDNNYLRSSSLFRNNSNDQHTLSVGNRNNQFNNMDRSRSYSREVSYRGNHESSNTSFIEQVSNDTSSHEQHSSESESSYKGQHSNESSCKEHQSINTFSSSNTPIPQINVESPLSHNGGKRSPAFNLTAIDTSRRSESLPPRKESNFIIQSPHVIKKDSDHSKLLIDRKQSSNLLNNDTILLHLSKRSTFSEKESLLNKNSILHKTSTMTLDNPFRTSVPLHTQTKINGRSLLQECEEYQLHTNFNIKNNNNLDVQMYYSDELTPSFQNCDQLSIRLSSTIPCDRLNSIDQNNTKILSSKIPINCINSLPIENEIPEGSSPLHKDLSTMDTISSCHSKKYVTSSIQKKEKQSSDLVLDNHVIQEQIIEKEENELKDEVRELLEERALTSLLTKEWREKRKNLRSGLSKNNDFNEDNISGMEKQMEACISHKNYCTELLDRAGIEKQMEECISHKNYCNELLDQAQKLELNTLQALFIANLNQNRCVTKRKNREVYRKVESTLEKPKPLSWEVVTYPQNGECSVPFKYRFPGFEEVKLEKKKESIQEQLIEESKISIPKNRTSRNNSRSKSKNNVRPSKCKNEKNVRNIFQNRNNLNMDETASCPPDFRRRSHLLDPKIRNSKNESARFSRITTIESIESIPTQVGNDIISDPLSPKEKFSILSTVQSPKNIRENKDFEESVSYNGECACGNFKYCFKLPSKEIDVMQCTCKLCWMNQRLHILIDNDDFELLESGYSSSRNMYSKRDQTRLIDCNKCGIISHFYPEKCPDKVAINLHTLDDYSPECEESSNLQTTIRKISKEHCNFKNSKKDSEYGQKKTEPIRSKQNPSPGQSVEKARRYSNSRSDCSSTGRYTSLQKTTDKGNSRRSSRYTSNQENLSSHGGGPQVVSLHSLNVPGNPAGNRVPACSPSRSRASSITNNNTLAGLCARLSLDSERILSKVEKSLSYRVPSEDLVIMQRFKKEKEKERERERAREMSKERSDHDVPRPKFGTKSGRSTSEFSQSLATASRNKDRSQLCAVGTMGNHTRPKKQSSIIMPEPNPRRALEARQGSIRWARQFTSQFDMNSTISFRK